MDYKKKKEVEGMLEVIRDFLWEEDAVSTVEIILILVVLIGLVVIFRDQLTSLVESLLSKAVSQSNGI